MSFIHNISVSELYSSNKTIVIFLWLYISLFVIFKREGRNGGQEGIERVVILNNPTFFLNHPTYYYFVNLWIAFEKFPI